LIARGLYCEDHIALAHICLICVYLCVFNKIKQKPIKALITTAIANNKNSNNNNNNSIMTLPRLSKQNVQEMINESSKNQILLDVRSREELNDMKPLPTAVNVPIGELLSAFNMNDQEFKNKYHFEKPEKNKKIVVYCRSGVRAQSAGETLQNLGYQNVYHYSGVADWYSN
jgi:rhodanese-related sulfurtransferase